MFDETETKRLISLLNELLPPNAEALAAARAKLLAGNFDLSAGERQALDTMLAGVEYKGNANAVLTLMQQVASMRMRLTPAKLQQPMNKKVKGKKPTASAEPADGA